MIKNYLKIAIRSFLKHKTLAFINVFGLSVGLACFSLFLLYAINEFSFDRFHSHADQMYRVYRWTADLDGEGEEGDPHLPMPLGPAMLAEFPDIEQVVRWKEAWGESFVRVGNEIGRAEISHVDQSFFDVFSFPLLFGNPESALADPKGVVLTHSTALKLFDESNPIGKTIEIQIDDTFDLFHISAVTDDIPVNSSKQFEILGSMDFFAKTEYGRKRQNSWNSSFLSVFVKLREGSGMAHNAKALLDFRRKYYPDTEENLRNDGLWDSDIPPITYKLQPIREMHTDPFIGGGEIPPVDPRNIWILLAMAAGILLIAIINFTTLSIGRSADRAKEVSIRKVIGSKPRQLSVQFLLESILLSTFSVVLGLVLAKVFLPYFNTLAGRELIFSLGQYPELPWLIVGLTLITGILAGVYPAMVLPKFKPVEIFKNKVRLGGANLFTNILVTAQFALSSGLLIATLIIFNQLQVLKSSNPGFDRENILVVHAEGTDTEVIYPLIKNKLKNNPNINGVAASDISLGAGSGWSRSGFEYKGELKQIYEYFIDDDYLDVLGMELIAGRNFVSDRQDGHNRSVIVNEELVRNFGWTIDNVIGREITGYSESGNNPRIIGVVKDFHFRSYREEVKPQMFHQYEHAQPFTFFVKILEGDPGPVLAIIDQAWSELVQGFPFKYSFLDEDVERFYRSETRLSKIMIWAVGLAIFLACLGLLGLITLATINRQKEIGIRKVMGASILNIIHTLTKDFVRLVVLAFVIASPIVWYLMDGWVDNYVVQYQINWWIFVLAVIFALGLAIIAISFQSFKAASSNPINSLRQD